MTGSRRCKPVVKVLGVQQQNLMRFADVLVLQRAVFRDGQPLGQNAGVSS